MKKLYTLLIVLVVNSLIVSAQIRTIQGRIVSEDLESLPHVLILQNDTIELGRTDQYGKFKVDISSDVISIASVGFETAIIGLKPDCDYVELVLMPSWHIDFASSRQVDKFRLKEFEKIPNLHSLAYANGIFRKKEVCYTREFRPDKPDLDRITKQTKARYAELKKTFKLINVGDTIGVPISRSINYDAEGRTALHGYSAYGSVPPNHCRVEGVVVSKHKKRGGLNLVYKVLTVGTCGAGCRYGDEIMLEGAKFDVNMKYYLIMPKKAVQL